MNSEHRLLEQPNSALGDVRLHSRPASANDISAILGPGNEINHTPNEVSKRKKTGILLQKARWYLSRLATMRSSEILWRTRRAAQLPADWLRWRMHRPAPNPDWSEFRQASYPFRLHSGGTPMHKIRIFDIEFPIGFEFDWHRDYRYGRQVERSFAGSLNIRDTNVVSDVKYVWEPSRHQHLSALAFSADGDRHADYIVRSIDSWLRENRFLSGVHWTSSLELAERLISWSLLYPRIADKVAREHEFRGLWLDSIYRHLERIADRLSLYSSANNHLIGELVGLYVGSACFDFWPQCRLWRERAKHLLMREILLQVGEDGVNREQAMSYHLFTMELLLLAFIIGLNIGDSFDPKYARRLQAMAGFVDAVATRSAELPWYGDSDEARGLVFAEDESSVDVSMQLAALIFQEPRWLRFCQTPTAAARALVPDLLSDLHPPTVSKPSLSELFPDAGLACVRSRSNEICLLMDFGPLGYPHPAGHGHADALSLWLSIHDEYFLVDAGTYAYHSHPEWRSYFRSTPAHNTASVDSRDQSEMAGRFLWSAKANARLLKFQSDTEQVIIEAEHDGYRRLSDPVTHRRRVAFDRGSGQIAIEDSFACSGSHQVELFFHMHEETEVAFVREGEARVIWRGRNIHFSSPDRNTCWQILSGSENPKFGWRSRHFNQKQPIPTLRIRAAITGSTTLRSCIRIES